MQQIALLGGVPQRCAPPPGAPKGVAERVGRLGGLFLLKAAPPERGGGEGSLSRRGRGACVSRRGKPIIRLRTRRGKLEGERGRAKGRQLPNKNERTGGNLGGGEDTSLRPALASPFPEPSPKAQFQNLLPNPRARGTHGGAGSVLPGRTDRRAHGLTRFLRRRRLCEVGARLLQRLLALALLRVDVLGLRLLAPRHGARIGAPGRALVTCHQFLELGNFTPLRPERACPSNYYYQ